MSDNSFVRADSNNLPNVDAFMLMEFIKANECFNAAEIRGVKAELSMRSNYIDNAVGYVSLKRVGHICTVQCEICPEHRVKGKNYKVVMEVDEDGETVNWVQCQDCPASAGGCKHSLAFLMWVHQKSTQAAPTTIECYWKKPKLSRVGTTIPFIKASDFGEVKHYDNPDAKNFLKYVIEEGQKVGAQCQLLKHFESDAGDVTRLGLHQMIHSFSALDQRTYEDFLMYAEVQMSDKLCKKVNQMTEAQSACDMWFELRYGRITASKIYTAAHSKKPDGVFVNSVIGNYKFFQTKSMERGIKLEEHVKNVITKKIGQRILPCGLILNKNYPELGASPDGIVGDYVVEIKCPSSHKNFHNYILINGGISAKYNAQMQLQMLMLNLNKGFFCVADPSFETNNIVTVIEVKLDELLLENTIKMARLFWKKEIFNRLLATVE